MIIEEQYRAHPGPTPPLWDLGTSLQRAPHSMPRLWTSGSQKKGPDSSLGLQLGLILTVLSLPLGQMASMPGQYLILSVPSRDITTVMVFDTNRPSLPGWYHINASDPSVALHKPFPENGASYRDPRVATSSLTISLGRARRYETYYINNTAWSAPQVGPRVTLSIS